MKMSLKLLFGIIFVIISPAHFQTVNNVRLVDHIEYIIKVIQEVVSEVEQKEWCNLKLPDIITNVDETVFDKHYLGTVTYTNGFVVAIQQVDIQQSTVQQVWTWNSTDSTATVSLRGTLRLIDLDIGYNVDAMADGHHRYTAVFRHPLISFAFSMNYNIHLEEFTSVTVDGTVPRNTLLPILLPQDNHTDVFTVLFDPTLTAPGIQNWGPDVFQVITQEVLARVEFPRICFNCPVI